ncbi:A disintegrin and metalloproteinase with thrombospondin motifs 7-like [Littorina saxatilis]|uniref:ADAMTS/ADAMTS-like cysteine-rich domain-containing protein n=1 Tax=Littorina saxatilis TaxID=31220 RepID=A0AAN9BNA9_9CAEN
MLPQAVFLLVCIIASSFALDKRRLEYIRQLHEHDGIDTATVHVAYPHSPTFRRLTRREASTHLLPRRHHNLKIKVTLDSTGHVLDMNLRPSELRFHGAKVRVRDGADSYQYLVHDNGCHYQGDPGQREGVVSLHFCDSTLVGAAHIEDLAYTFHPQPDGDPKMNTDKTVLESQMQKDIPLFSGGEHKVIVSWRNVSGAKENRQPGKKPDAFSQPSKIPDASRQSLKRRKAYARPLKMRKRYARPSNLTTGMKKNHTRRAEQQTFESVKNDHPVVECGVVFDEDYLDNFKYFWRTHNDLVNLLVIRFTGVQAIYLTGFNFTFHLKRVEVWHTNPPWFTKTNYMELGPRLIIGKLLDARDPDFAALDSGAIFTSKVESSATGMAFGTGICAKGIKNYISQSRHVDWITETHEFGHTVDLGHPPQCCDVNPTGCNTGFMGVGRLFLDCYYDRIYKFFSERSQKWCIYREDVYSYGEYLPIYSTFPVIELGLDYHCRVAFRSDSEFVKLDYGGCATGLCTVLDESSPDYGLALIDRYTNGRACGPNDDNACIGKLCMAPSTVTRAFTTIRLPPRASRVEGTGTWAPWSSYSSACSSACGTGVQISTRKCSNANRVEACSGWSRFRGKLCNEQPCPGDSSLEEKELRVDRASYVCSLARAKGAFGSKYFYGNSSFRKSSFTVLETSCVVYCNTPADVPPFLQRNDKAGVLLQADGTLCGSIRIFDRLVLGLTARCLRGRCVEFGCDGQSMEQRSEGKLLDLCGVCGGDNSTCTSGDTNITVPGGDTLQEVHVLPTGTRKITFAVDNGPTIRPDVRLALTDKDDNHVLVVGSDKRRARFTDNPQHPRNFAGTHWTIRLGSMITADGPIDRPMKIMVKNKSRDVRTVVMHWAFQPPATIPAPPTCQNSGVANASIGGCLCPQTKTYGKQCEYTCYDFCDNGGKKKSDCRCDCSSNPRTFQARCTCKTQYEGPDCNECKPVKECFNGGTLSTATCECQCTAGCGGLDCSDCSYNPLLTEYHGHYGGGSMEINMTLETVRRAEQKRAR